MRTILSGFVAALALGAVLAVAPSHAGDGNTIYIIQESPAGSASGNTLSVDQSQASDSFVLGPGDGLLQHVRTLDRSGIVDESVPDALVSSQTSLVPALQRGSGNIATLTIEGSNAEIQLLQDNQNYLYLADSGNVATVVTASANSLGAIVQEGGGNNATLSLGNNAQGLIGQFGTNLTADLTVPGSSSGQIVQIGNNSQATLSVNSGASVTYTQVGDNLGSVNPATVQVFTTNPGNITITQTGF